MTWCYQGDGQRLNASQLFSTKKTIAKLQQQTKQWYCHSPSTLHRTSARWPSGEMSQQADEPAVTMKPRRMDSGKRVTAGKPGKLTPGRIPFGWNVCPRPSATPHCRAGPPWKHWYSHSNARNRPALSVLGNRSCTAARVNAVAKPAYPAGCR